ncbi:MAG: glycosyltransferase family 4 protein [Anaerolineales bacterium]
MDKRISRRLCLIPHVPGHAGPAAFQSRLALGLERRGIEVTFDAAAQDLDAVLVNGGTRHLRRLRQLRARGLPVIQRLDGMNWIHRRRRTGAVHFLRAELNNLNLRLIRRRFSDGQVYQSQFSQAWWLRVGGQIQKPAKVVYNGVPLDDYTPGSGTARTPDCIRLAVIEGRLAGGYEIGLEWALGLAAGLSRQAHKRVELLIAGMAQPEVIPKAPGDGVEVHWLGEVAPEAIPDLDRSADLLFAADLHPACPNSVIEAMACGLPVVSYDTGALPEMVVGDAGRLAAYGSDSWRVEPPDAGSLLDAALEVLAEPDRFRKGARRRAEEAFGLERTVEGYLAALGWA